MTELGNTHVANKKKREVAIIYEIYTPLWHTR